MEPTPRVCCVWHWSVVSTLNIILMPVWKAMIRYKSLFFSLYQGIQGVWRVTFVLIFMSTFLIAGTRYYISKPRSLAFVFGVLRKLGYPLYAQESAIEWKWNRRPCIAVRNFCWNDTHLVVNIAHAQCELKYLLTHPVGALWANKIHIEYSQPKSMPLNLLMLWSSLGNIFQRLLQVEQCSILGGISIVKDGVLQTRIKSFSWTPKNKHQKIFGYLDGPLGKGSWMYIPSKHYVQGRFSNGMGMLMQTLGYPGDILHPISVEFFVHSSQPNIKVTWDKKDFLVKKKKYHMDKGMLIGDWNAHHGTLKGKLGIEGMTLFFKGKYHNTWTLSWKSTGIISIKALALWWNKHWGTNAKNWVDTHFKSGHLDQLQGRISGAYDTVHNLNGSFCIKNALLNVLPGIPEIQNVYSKAAFNLNEFNFYLEKALFSKQRIGSGHVRIQDLSQNSILNFGARLEGSVQDVLTILSCKKLKVAQYLPIQNPQGTAHTHLRMRFPLVLNLLLQDIILEYESGFEKTQFQLDALGVSLPYKKGNIQIKGTQHDISIQGKGEMNHHPVVWTWNGIFKDSLNQKLTMNLWIDPCLWIPKWIHSCLKKELFPINLVYFPGRGHLSAFMDGKKVALNIPWLNWYKNSYDALTLRCNFFEKSKELIFDTKGSIESQGKFVLTSAPKGWARLHIPGTVQGSVMLESDVQKIRFICKYLDLSALKLDIHPPKTSKKKLDKKDFSHKKQIRVDAAFNIQTLKWDKTTQLKGLRGILSWRQPHNPSYSRLDLGQYRWLKSQAQCAIHSLNTVSTVHFSTIPVQNSTSIHLSVKELGGIFHMLGLKSIIRSGESGEWIGKQTSDGTYKGQLVCRDVVTQGLWMAKLLSLLSPSAVTELLHSSLDFSEISAKCVYKAGVLQLKKGIARGLNLGAFLKGDVNFKKNTLFLKGGVVPAYFFNTLFSRIPIIGHILGQEKGIISSQIIITGCLEDPEFFVNPFSVFELGGLKTLFESRQT